MIDIEKIRQLVLRKDGTLCGKKTNEEWFVKHGYLTEWNQFLSRTDALSNYTIRARFFLLFQGYETPPLCAHCGQPTTIDQKIIHKFCSIQCASNSELVQSQRTTTMVERYGVSHQMHLADVKEKIKETCMARYGETSATRAPQIRAKIAATNLSRYGVTVAAKNVTVKEKTKETCLVKYGGHHARLPETKNKHRQTCFVKYGRKSNFQLILSTATIKQLEDREWLINEYKTKSSVQIGEEIGCYYGTVLSYLRQYGCVITKAKNRSRFENEIATFLDGLNIDYITNDRTVLAGKEIDILINDHKLGIEIDGVYWHQSQPKTYHQNKTADANAKGIELIHITDVDLVDPRRSSIIFSILKSRLGINIKLGARSLSLKEITPKEASGFLKENHIQGACKSKIKIGLYEKDELVMLATFDSPRFTSKYDWELIRVCTKKGITVVGGFSRLMAHFRSTHQGTLMSYVDLQYFSGKGYNKDWVLQKITPPGYFWTDGKQFITRFKTQKNQLKKWLTTYDDTKSETQNMEDAGFMRYWNCGNALYTLT